MKRRLHSAVIAFGGNINKHKLQMLSPFNNNRGNAYGSGLEKRFFDNQTRLSWDVEERAPAEIENGVNFISSLDKSSSDDPLSTEDKTSKSFDDEDRESILEFGRSMSYSSSKKLQDIPKTRYRCKLCGQPKQNHICPYQQSLQRNIGTMSYPALNSFECSEPGKLAPSLSDMNNFVTNIEDDQIEQGISIKSSFKEGPKWNPLEDPNTKTLPISPSTNERSFLSKLKNKKRKISIMSSCVKTGSAEYSKDKLMLPKGDSKPEHYKEISTTASAGHGSYVYPTLPLTYMQRHSMSDSLFNLCKERFGLVEECSQVLDNAKLSNSWDLAIAELTTQILFILYCTLGDRTVESLHKYLLLMGISC